MPKTLRLTAKEQELLRNKTTDLNKRLVACNREPLKDSELAHIALKVGISSLKVSQSGEVIVDPD